jgi:hypothetical protein
MLRLFMIVLWPSFLVAIVGEGLLFSLLDPFSSSLADRKEVLPPIATYTIGFFLLWGVCALSSMLTWYLSGTPKKAN